MDIRIMFLAVAAVIVAVGAMAEKHVEDQSWQRKKSWRQQVRECRQHYAVRHRACYAEIGWKPGRR